MYLNSFVKLDGLNLLYIGFKMNEELYNNII